MVKYILVSLIFLKRLTKKLGDRRINHMKKKILYSLTLLVFMFILAGCAKCISTETSTVQVKIIDEYHRAAYTTMYYNSATKTMIPQSHPAVYRITVEYNGAEYDISGSNTYNKYSDKIGEYVDGILETKKYDDGTVRYNIADLP